MCTIFYITTDLDLEITYNKRNKYILMHLMILKYIIF